MLFKGIHHVAIIVSDYEVSKKFYTEILGLTEIRENFQPKRGSYKLDLDMGSCELEMFYIPGAPPRPTNPEACGLRHLAFEVENFQETIDRLTQLGIQVEPVRIDPYDSVRFTFIKDPDGLPLELREA